jgi:hypothetical protein
LRPILAGCQGREIASAWIIIVLFRDAGLRPKWLTHKMRNDRTFAAQARTVTIVILLLGDATGIPPAARAAGFPVMGDAWRA